MRNRYFLLGLSCFVSFGLGWLAATVKSELDVVENTVLNATGKIGALEFYIDKRSSEIICFEQYLLLADLHELNAIIDAKEIIHILKPNLMSEAKQGKAQMQKILTTAKDKIICDETTFQITNTLKELGYDL